MTDEPKATAPLDFYAAAAAELTRLFDAARWDVRLYSHDLDGRVYATEEVLDAVKAAQG